MYSVDIYPAYEGWCPYARATVILGNGTVQEYSRALSVSLWEPAIHIALVIGPFERELHFKLTAAMINSITPDPGVGYYIFDMILLSQLTVFLVNAFLMQGSCVANVIAVVARPKERLLHCRRRLRDTHSLQTPSSVVPIRLHTAHTLAVLNSLLNSSSNSALSWPSDISLHVVLDPDCFYGDILGHRHRSHRHVKL
ncbi:hypothetical protein BV20DRAFT_599366 [Pilatotrama ljubarskyi]|nr:hypothetical protein BV20DRAFT_599366 [Pilatotrama ljubarskyi]